MLLACPPPRTGPKHPQHRLYIYLSFDFHSKTTKSSLYCAISSAQSRVTSRGASGAPIPFLRLKALKVLCPGTAEPLSRKCGQTSLPLHLSSTPLRSPVSCRLSNRLHNPRSRDSGATLGEPTASSVASPTISQPTYRPENALLQSTVGRQWGPATATRRLPPNPWRPSATCCPPRPRREACSLAPSAKARGPLLLGARGKEKKKKRSRSLPPPFPEAGTPELAPKPAKPHLPRGARAASPTQTPEPLQGPDRQLRTGEWGSTGRKTTPRGVARRPARPAGDVT